MSLRFSALPRLAWLLWYLLCVWGWGTCTHMRVHVQARGQTWCHSSGAVPSFLQMGLIRQTRLSSQRVQGATSANTATPEFLFVWWESNTAPQQLSSKRFTDGASFQLLLFPILGPAYLPLTWCCMTAVASCSSLLAPFDSLLFLFMISPLCSLSKLQQ